MRLLNSKSLKFKEFNGTDTPKYAILSHTWGDDEVMFDDIAKQKPDVEHKRGYAKIAHCCGQAEADDLCWVWVDTCCIKRKFETELSESIMSMYAWYRNARVCYVYLEDVYSDYDNCKEEVKRARWFTRGWCLQELIASSEVEFYNVHWQFLGTKSILEPLLQERTSIPAEVLNLTKQPQSYHVAQRLSWASTRTTSKIEDKAYCLLGILGLDSKMAPKYGEGEEAFVRLQKEVIMNPGSEDFSVFLWTNESSRFSGGVFALEPSMFPKEGLRGICNPKSIDETAIHCEYQYIKSFRDYERIGTSLAKQISFKAAKYNSRGIQVDAYVRKERSKIPKRPALYMWTYYIYESESEKYLVCIMLKQGKYGLYQNEAYRRSHRKAIFLIHEEEFESFERSKLDLNTDVEPTSTVARNKKTLVAAGGVAGIAVAGGYYIASRHLDFFFLSNVLGNGSHR